MKKFRCTAGDVDRQFQKALIKFANDTKPRKAWLKKRKSYEKLNGIRR